MVSSFAVSRTALTRFLFHPTGSTVAQFCGETLYKRLTDLDSFEQGNYQDALKRVFLQTDEDLLNGTSVLVCLCHASQDTNLLLALTDPNHVNDPSGCTAVAALIETAKDNPKKVEKIYVANAGDSRCVLSNLGHSRPLSYDHKPTLDSEYNRISKAGGYVSWGRVNGNLALSRAIGDFEFKRNSDMRAEDQIVTADPEITVTSADGGEEFVVLACDGIWDCLSSQDVVDIARRGIANGKEIKDICEDLMDRCLAPDSDTGGIGCDNMTVCIVALLNGRTKQEWYEWVKKNLEDTTNGYPTPQDVPPVFKSQGSPNAQEGGVGGPGTVSIQSLLSGGLARGEDEDDESGSALRLPGGLAGALSGAGIVFRPGGTSEGGEVVYEAHVVDEDDSDDNDQDSDNADAHQASQQAGSTQPELVESPRTDAKAASTARVQNAMEVDDDNDAPKPPTKSA